MRSRGTWRRAGRFARLIACSLAASTLLALPARADDRPASADDLLARFDTDPAAAQAMLDLARAAFDAYVLRHERVTPPDDLPPLLSERSAAFVSAILGDAPRCCMGSVHPTRPTIAAEVVHAARMAAGLDARFPPITPAELPRLRLIVSVLAPPEPIASPAGLDPLVEGLAVRGPRRWGVVLPAETPRAELMEPWARVRAGVGESDRVDYYRVRAFRILEPVREP